MNIGRMFRKSVAPLVFISVVAVSWFLTSWWYEQNHPSICRGGSLAAAEGSGAEGNARMGQGVAGTVSTPTSGDSTPAASLVSVSQAGSASPSEGVPAIALPSGASDDAHEEQVRLLDGGMGNAPATMMDCSLDGGFRCGECTHDAECPSGKACAINRQTRHFECVSSECEDDRSCFPGTVCRVIGERAPPNEVRRCVKAGQLGEGAHCRAIPDAESEACREELLCVQGICGRRCVPGARAGCPEGLVCEESYNGAACIPDCRRSGCEGGNRCAEIRKGVFQCTQLGVDECDTDRPCPSGQSCVVFALQGRGGRFCAAPCRSWAGNADCPDGYVCGQGGPQGSSCYQACSLRNPFVCPDKWMCRTVSEDLQTWGCKPDIHI